MLRCPSNGYGYGQPHSTTTNYHRTHSGEHVTKVAERPCHSGGAVLQHHVVHKASLKQVDEGKKPQAPARERCFDNYPMVKANTYSAMAASHRGGGSHHRYVEKKETYDYVETTCVETSETYDYGETSDEEEEEEEEEEEFVVGGGGGCFAQAQLRRGYCRA